MVDSRLKVLSMENHHPSTLLSMDSSASSSHEELDLEMNRQISPLTRPPDINLPLSVYETDHSFLIAPKAGKKCAKRLDSIWGAWFFFTFYFRPVLNEKSKTKVIRDSNGVSGFEKSDLQLDIFMVQHDMENMYMWVFKERPENALGKMQLRSYMNGHSRQGERPFPFSVERGFVRSHRMQRKQYRGLSNPQCVHGIEIVQSPSLVCLGDDDRKRWVELTGRDLNFAIPAEAIGFSSWRNLPITEFELERPVANANSKKTVGNDDPMELSPISKRRKDFDECFLSVIPPPLPPLERIEPNWLSDFSGVMRENIYGPVTAAKTIYEDESGYLIMISLPLVDLQRVKVSWRNTLTNGIIKVSCSSMSRFPYIKRRDRTFKLVDPSSEHCPPGEFVREITLSTRIPEDANIEAYYDGPGTVLEIMVPKLREGPEEHEVRVCRRPHHGNGGAGGDLMLT